MLAALDEAPAPARRGRAARAATSSGSSCRTASNAGEVLERAEAGVTAVLGTDFGGAANTIRLAYSYVSPDEIDEGVERLAALVAAPVPA